MGIQAERTVIAMSALELQEPPAFDLLVEDAGTDGCLGHIPALPGLCFRAETAAELESKALARIAEYARWLLAEDLADLTPASDLLTRRLGTSELSGVRVVVTEHVAGAPVWESGNAAVLFDHDRRSLDDDAVVAHLRFVRRVLDRMRELVRSLSPEQLAGRPTPDRRSIDETIEHIGNCVWWYCSRIDDALPEPEDVPNETPLDRVDRLFAAAEVYLLGVPLSARTAVHVPARFPTADPQERWTHAKVCRRQAEHVWAHLPGLKTAVRGMTPVG
jgi:hypothetical protein